MTTTKRPGPASRLREARRQQVFVDEEEDNANGGSGSARTVDMAFLSNGTSFVDGSGVGHVKVNESMDWSDVLRNDTTVHIIYQGSGSHEEILIIPVNETAPNSVDSSSGGSSGSDSESGSASGNSTLSPVNSLPTGSSAGGSDSSTGDEGVAGTASSPLTLVIVASVLALISIAAVIAVVLYGRRNRRRAYSEDPSNTDMPFIVGHLPHQAAPELSVLDTDITPDLWVEGQYQYSPNMSGLQNSLNGTAILSDNNTTPAHHRLTVDAYPLGPNTRRGQRYRDNNAQEDISDRGRHRTGTTPVVLYEHDSIEERKTNSSRRQQSQHPSRRQQQHHPSQRSQQQHPSQRSQHPDRMSQQQQQERMSRRDKFATRRDR